MQFIPTLLFVATLFLCKISAGQFTDNFSDGAIDGWSGDVSNFIANGDSLLQLQGDCAAGGQNYISAAVTTKDSVVWEFYVDFDFDPSASNYARVYLQSDQPNLIGDLNGYFLKIGEDGTGDVIRLYRQDGATFVIVCDGITNIATSPTLGIKVVRTNDAEWQLYLDPTGNTDYVFENAATDAVYNGGNYFGFFCKYTSTRCDLFYFDDVYIDPLYVDTEAPELLAATIISPTELEVDFNENVEQISSETESNYSVDGGVGQPINATRDAVDLSKVLLTFAAPFPEATVLTITVSEIADENGNAIISDSETFSYYTVKQYDVVMNEIFADLEPTVALPLAEYIELYNQAPVDLNLEGWVISDAGTESDPMPSYVLPAGGYVILCANSNITYFTAYPNVLGVESFPGLNNDGDFLMLFDANGNLIHNADYNLEWYDNAIKEDGGWSLEMIDPQNPCEGDGNWTASENINGGTPGTINSVYGLNPDETAPALISAYPLASDTLILYFDEALDQNNISTSNFFIDNDIGEPTGVFTEIIYPAQVKLSLAEPLYTNMIYTVTVNGVTDCAGNSITAFNTISFGLPEPIDSFDLVINEVLFNPYSGSFDFVELYNRSDKILDLSDLIIAEIDITDETNILESSYLTETGKLCFPGDYIVLSSSSSDITSTYLATDNGNFIEPPSMPNYDDKEGIVVLYDQTLNTIDQFHFYDDWHYELLTDENGVSLERVNYEKATQNQDNWHSAATDAGYATPGSQNSMFGDINPGADISFEYEVFSPDGDGYHDLLIISYATPTDGYSGSIKIYDAQGRLVKQLTNNELLSREGFVTWDGVTDDSDAAKMGIYILYAEFFNLSGDVEKHKKKLTLVRKQ